MAGGASPQAVAVTFPGGLPAAYQVAVTPSMLAQAGRSAKAAVKNQRLYYSISARRIEMLINPEHLQAIR